MSEIAVLSLNENKLKRADEEGNAKAAKLLRLLKTPEKFLSTIQVCITLAGFLASAFAADSFAQALSDALIKKGIYIFSAGFTETLALILVTVILSYFTLVFGELIPKRIAMKNPEKIASAVCGVIIFFSVLLKPVVWLLSVSTNGVLRLCGINPKDGEEDVTEDEIRLMVDIGEENGTIEPAEKEMIENIFEFNNTTAADVMTHRTAMSVISIDDDEDTIIKTIVETGSSRFPVYEEDIDDIIGILNARIYLLNLRAENPVPMRELLYAPYLVPESVPADVLFRDMQKKKTHMAIVVDEYGGTAGLVTMEDLIEEIFGNIYDELDPAAKQQIIKSDDGSWMIAGGAELVEVEEALDIELSEETYENFDTFGGIILSRLTTIPEDGDTPVVDYDNLHIEVVKVEDRRIEWAKVSVIPDSDGDNEKDEEKQ